MDGGFFTRRKKEDEKMARKRQRYNSKLDAVLRARGETLHSVARRAGISYTSALRVIRGRALVESPETKIARALGVEVAKIFP
jgi:lambda repressor-like predicted transcriptional regulator